MTKFWIPAFAGMFMSLRAPLSMKTTVGRRGWLVQPCIAFFGGMTNEAKAYYTGSKLPLAHCIAAFGTLPNLPVKSH